MKIYIMTDLEGPAMVSRWNQTRDVQDDPSRKHEAMTLLTGEINASVDGILDIDPDAEVVVWDGHGSGGIDVLQFHPRAKLIARGPIRPPYYLDSSYDALFFVGQHAMAGTPDAPLCHTYSSRVVESFTLNGLAVGEFGARALMAGSLGVPTVFLAGDDKAAAEARALVPGIHAAEVKQGLGVELALHLSPVAARVLVRKTAAEAVRDISNIPPAIMDPPYELVIRAKPGMTLEHWIDQGAEPIDERTVVMRSDNLCELPL